MTGEDTQPGQPFDGRYRVLGRLGVGGMATVYLAEDSSLGRKVALKVMAERYAEDGEFVERFRREAQAAARLNHPNIIAVYDRGEADGRPYIAMEYLQGRTLKQVIQKEGPLPPERAIAVAMQVLAGLRYAHEHGVVHRDVKPHNVLVGDDGRIKVTDFGIAHAGDPQMTEVGSIVGTAQYLSPEQARGRSVGPQTDVYSLGVVLYEMLAGRVPFEGDSSVAIAMQHVSDEPPPLRSLVPDVPESLAMVVAHSMLKQPDAALRQRRRVLRRPRPGPARPRAGRGDRADRDAAARADRAGARGRGDAHRPAGRAAPVAAERREAAAAARSAQALALALAARPAPGAGGRRARGVRARRGLGRRHADDVGEQTRRPPRRRRPRSLRTCSRISTGKTFSEASSALRGYGIKPLEIRRQRVRHDQAEAGIVVATVPPADAELHPGDTVLLKVSRGQKEVPDVVDATRADARAQLGTDFTIVEKSEPSEVVDKGKITRTDPAAPQRIPVGSRVTIWVSTGPASVQVPRLTGKTEDEARATLTSAGLLVREPPGSRCSDDVEVGQVAKQTPETGRLVRKGTAISFDLANSPCTVDVPNVRNLPVDQAVQNLQAATVRNIKIVDQTVTEPTQDGIVLDQDIEGTNAKPFQVTLTVGRLDTAVTAPTTP